MRKKVYVTRKIPAVGLELLRKEFDVEINPEDKVLSKEELIEAVKGKDAILSLLTDNIDGVVMDAAGSGLKVISNYAVGYNNIDTDAATLRGILVTNTPGVVTESTADLAFALLISAARRVPEADRFSREGKFIGWDPLLFLGVELSKKTLGILGMGRIGSAMARRAKGFGMDIIYYDMVRAPDSVVKEIGAKYVSFEKLLMDSDFISIHVPLLPETRHMIGEKQLHMMKRTAILVNTARGPVIDEKALTKALEEKRIFAAGLDVFEEEPKIYEGLKTLSNAVILPHIGSATIETRDLMSEMSSKNIILALSGKDPLSLVNPDVKGHSRAKG